MKTKYAVIFALAAVTSSCGGNSVKNTGSAALEPVGNTVVVSQVIVLSDSLIASKGADTINMGRMRSGEVVSRTIAIKNEDDKPLVITEVDKTCGCVDLDQPKQPLMPGQQYPFDIRFDSKGISGWVFKTVYLKTSSESGNYTLVVTADVE